MAQITLKLQAGQSHDEEQAVIAQIEGLNGIAFLDWAYPDDLRDAELRLIYEANLNDLAHTGTLVTIIRALPGVEYASRQPEKKFIVQGPSPR